MSDANRLLIVCHGRGRGRLYGTPQRIIGDVCRGAGIDERVDIHETGSPAPDVSRYAAVLFWLGDPLRELYPECHAEAKALEAAARESGARVLNAPDALSHSIKSQQARIWREAELPAAPAVAFTTRDEMDERLGEIEFPALLRSDQQHTQASVTFCATREDVARLRDDQIVLPGVAMPFIDTRAGYQRDEPDSVFARFFHKKRAMVFDDDVVSNHILFSEERVVGMRQSTFSRHVRHRGRFSWLAYLKRWDRATLAADLAFFRGPPEEPELMRRAVRSLGLDFAAVDYSTLVDGSVVLWEANPFFDLPHWKFGVMPRERHLRERTQVSYEAMGRCFRRWLV